MEWTGYCFKLQTSPKGDEGCKWGISEVNPQDASNLICFWMITELADCVPEYLIMLLSEWCPEGCYHIWTSSFSCPRQIEHSVFKKHQQLIRPLCYSQSGRSACMWFFPSAQKQSRPLSKHKPPDLLTNVVSCSLRLKKTLTVCLLWPLPGQNGNPPDLISLTNY